MKEPSSILRVLNVILEKYSDFKFNVWYYFLSLWPLLLGWGLYNAWQWHMATAEVRVANPSLEGNALIRSIMGIVFSFFWYLFRREKRKEKEKTSSLK